MSAHLGPREQEADRSVDQLETLGLLDVESIQITGLCSRERRGGSCWGTSGAHDDHRRRQTLTSPGRHPPRSRASSRESLQVEALPCTIQPRPSHPCAAPVGADGLPIIGSVTGAASSTSSARHGTASPSTSTRKLVELGDASWLRQRYVIE